MNINELKKKKTLTPAKGGRKQNNQKKKKKKNYDTYTNANCFASLDKWDPPN